MDSQEKRPNDTTPISQSKKKKACAECRQQKMRCDAAPDGSDPCSRCRRLNISCSISPSFKRTHKRKRLLELEEETNALKRQLLSSAPAPVPDRQEPEAAPLYGQSIDESSIVESGSGSLLPFFQGTQLAEDGTGAPINPLSVEAYVQRRRNIRSRDPTVSRTLDGLELEPSMIDDCFELYFRHYHPILPVLDASLSPNYYHSRAPFLFWLVVSIGSRRYNTHPTLTNGLAPRVTHLAFTSLNARSTPLHAIKGLILLLSWPFSSTAFYRDPSFVLSGSLLHMATQCGLHTPVFSHDFSKTDRDRATPSKRDILRRAEIWLYVVLIYQRSCIGSGQAALASLEIFNEQVQFQALLEELPPTLRLQMRISSISARAQKAFLEIGLVEMTVQQERTMDSVIKIFHGELNGLEPSASSDWDRFYVAAARQDICVMHFYKSASTLDLQSSISIFESTAKVFEHIHVLEKDYRLSHFCTRFIFSIALMGLSYLIRLFKGPLAAYLDQERGSTLFQNAMTFCRSSSLERGDLPERTATVADQMWRSEKIFKDINGGINIALRVRNRLSGSPLYDAIRWWREEFVEHRLHSEISVGVDAGIGPPSTTVDPTVPPPPISMQNGISPDFFTAPDFLLQDGLWDDLGLDLADGWGLGGSNMSWVI